MAFEKLPKSLNEIKCDRDYGLGGYDKRSGKPNPNQVEGYFYGKKIIPSKKKNQKPSNLYIFETKNGLDGVWGRTNMVHEMKKVEAFMKKNPGKAFCVRVTQDGFKPTENGDMYLYEAEIDKDNFIPLDVYDETDVENVSENISESENEPDEDDVQDEPPARAPSTRTTPPTSAGMSKVAELAAKYKRA